MMIMDNDCFHYLISDNLVISDFPFQGEIRYPPTRKIRTTENNRKQYLRNNNCSKEVEEKDEIDFLLDNDNFNNYISYEGNSEGSSGSGERERGWSDSYTSDGGINDENNYFNDDNDINHGNIGYNNDNIDNHDLNDENIHNRNNNNDNNNGNNENNNENNNNQNNEEEDSESDEEYIEFDYALNKNMYVDHILEGCRDYKRKKQVRDIRQEYYDNNNIINNNYTTNTPHKKNRKIGFYDSENCCSYRGNFFNDKPHGIGIIELRNGQTFHGNFIRGIMK